jgi:hypothetical protein
LSNHGHAADVAVPDITLGSKAAGVERIAGIIGVAGLFLCVAGYFTSPPKFFQSYLFAFLYWVGFPVGGLGILLLNNVVGGKWGVTIRRYLEASARTMPLMAIFFLGILLGLKYIYAWATPANVAANEFLKHKEAYLNIPAFIGRAVFCLGLYLFFVWRLNKWTDEQDRTGDPAIRDKMRKFSAPALLVFEQAISVSYIDWLLSADTQFYSTVFGGLVLIGNVQQTFALSILALILTSGEDRFHSRVNAPILHDLGKLLFAFTIFWTYLSASQLIIIWPANLPQELTWYLDRTHGFWKALATFVGLTMFAIPFLALLSQARKKDPRRLRRVAVWVLVVNAIYMFWLVEPTFRSTSASTPLHTSPGFNIYWTDIAAFFGIGGIWVYYFIGQLRRRPLLPLKDPRVSPSLPQEVIA